MDLVLALVLATASPVADPTAAPLSPAPAASPASAPTAPTANAYILGPNDEIQVSVFGGHPFDVKTRIKEDGTVTLPNVADINAAGMTPASLSGMVRERLKAGGFFVDPIVNVEVTAFVSRSVTLFGSMQTPGLYPLDRPQTIAMMLSRAGGVRGDAADYVVLQRKGATDRKIALDDPSASTAMSEPLLPGDVLFLPKAADIYVYGQVNKPGKFSLESGMTLRMAIAQAGGPTLAGSERKTTLRRKGNMTKRADLDSPVQAGDVLFVNERTF